MRVASAGDTGTRMPAARMRSIVSENFLGLLREPGLGFTVEKDNGVMSSRG